MSWSSVCPLPIWALEPAAGVDLLVCEPTFLSADPQLAEHSGHLTPRGAGRLAAEAGARRLVLSHFSNRYPDARVLAAEAREEFEDVVLAEDLLHIAVPSRHPAVEG